MFLTFIGLVVFILGGVVLFHGCSREKAEFIGFGIFSILGVLAISIVSFVSTISAENQRKNDACAASGGMMVSINGRSEICAKIEVVGS